MKRFLFALLVLFLITVLLKGGAGAGNGSLQVKDSPQIDITHIAGSVERMDVSHFLSIFRIERWKQLTSRDVIRAGDRIRTGSDGRLEFYLGKEIFIKVSAGSEIIIGENLSRGSSLGLKSGRIWARFKNLWQKITSFEVITPSAVAGVRGTLFSVFTDGDSTLLSVKEGKVEFKAISGKEGIIVNTNQMSIARSGRISSPVKMDEKEAAVWEEKEVSEWIKKGEKIHSGYHQKDKKGDKDIEEVENSKFGGKIEDGEKDEKGQHKEDFAEHGEQDEKSGEKNGQDRKQVKDYQDGEKHDDEKGEDEDTDEQPMKPMEEEENDD